MSEIRGGGTGALEVGADAYLFKVHSYRLQLPDAVIHIDVHEVIHGPSPAKFIAVPMDMPAMERKALDRFYGEGDTESEALNDCLRRIRDVTRDAIFGSG
jgi:hypothetical protein